MYFPITSHPAVFPFSLPALSNRPKYISQYNKTETPAPQKKIRKNE
jgi:hypothetical protein